MNVEVDEDIGIVTVGGQRFTFKFFEALTEPDEEWLYRLRKIDGVVTITKVMRLEGPDRERDGALH